MFECLLKLKPRGVNEGEHITRDVNRSIIYM